MKPRFGRERMGILRKKERDEWMDSRGRRVGAWLTLASPWDDTDWERIRSGPRSNQRTKVAVGFRPSASASKQFSQVGWWNGRHLRERASGRSLPTWFSWAAVPADFSVAPRFSSSCLGMTACPARGDRLSRSAAAVAGQVVTTHRPCSQGDDECQLGDSTRNAKRIDAEHHTALRRERRPGISRIGEDDDRLRPWPQQFALRHSARIDPIHESFRIPRMPLTPSERDGSRPRVSKVARFG